MKQRHRIGTRGGGPHIRFHLPLRAIKLHRRDGFPQVGSNFTLCSLAPCIQLLIFAASTSPSFVYNWLSAFRLIHRYNPVAVPLF
jgi:hypothetical protein